MNGDNKYEKILVSETTVKGMSWNIDDIKYMQRMFTLQDDYFEEVLDRRDKILIEQLAEISCQQNKLIFEELKKQTTQIAAILTEIALINQRLDSTDAKIENNEIRIQALEKYSSWENTTVRIILAVTLSVLTFIGISWASKFFKL
jgi:septal ring factor EnvC (AmiA/AmiB activator)